MKCGECLMERVQMVDLVDGVCPKCGADYRDYRHLEPKANEEPKPDIQVAYYPEQPR